MFEKSHTVPGLGPVVIGPCVAHNTNGRYDVTFDEYVLKKPSEEKK